MLRHGLASRADTQPRSGKSGSSGSSGDVRDWADAGPVKVKLIPVLCQALAESGLENDVLIQLQIRLCRNV